MNYRYANSGMKIFYFGNSKCQYVDKSLSHDN